MNAITLGLHIVAGALGLLAGYVALYSAKGAPLHRTSGNVFVYTMIVMSLLGGLIALVRSKAPAGNVPVAFLTVYLVITALTTVRPVGVASRRLDAGMMVLVAAITLTFFTFGALAISSPQGSLNGFPAAPFFIFGSIALLASIGDVRLIRSGGARAIRGTRRLARHLWRMSTALLIAALSASVQFGKLIPEPYRVPGLLAVPLLAIVVTMLYWLWRVRVRRKLRGVILALPDAAEPA
jgi:uncharacterized membrane protein